MTYCGYRIIYWFEQIDNTLITLKITKLDINKLDIISFHTFRFTHQVGGERKKWTIWVFLSTLSSHTLGNLEASLSGMKCYLKVKKIYFNNIIAFSKTLALLFYFTQSSWFYECIRIKDDSYLFRKIMEISGHLNFLLCTLVFGHHW